MGQYHRFLRVDVPEDGHVRLSDSRPGKMVSICGSQDLAGLLTALNADGFQDHPMEGVWAGVPILLAGDYGEPGTVGHYDGPSLVADDKAPPYDCARTHGFVFANQDLEELRAVDPHGPEMVLATDFVVRLLRLVRDGERARARAWVEGLLDGRFEPL